MKWIAPLFLIFAVLTSALAAPSPVIFIVRHAEKATSSDKDPDLSEAGHVRAEALAKNLKDKGIVAIYATEFKRTQQTAAPLAQALGIKVTIRAASATDFAQKLKTTDGNALVVGHSNTIPDLLKELGIADPPDIKENDYDNLFVVTLGPTPRMTRLRYP